MNNNAISETNDNLLDRRSSAVHLITISESDSVYCVLIDIQRLTMHITVVERDVASIIALRTNGVQSC